MVTAAEHVVRVFPTKRNERNRPLLWLAVCETCALSSVPVMFKANADDWRDGHLRGER